MQLLMQRHDIQALATRVLERVERNRRRNTSATASKNKCNKPAPKRDLKVASGKEPQKKANGHKPRLVVDNIRAGVHRRKKLCCTSRVEVDGKPLVFLNQNNVDDVRAHLVRKFGKGRVGSITAIGVPRSREPS